MSHEMSGPSANGESAKYPEVSTGVDEVAGDLATDTSEVGEGSGGGSLVFEVDPPKRFSVMVLTPRLPIDPITTVTFKLAIDLPHPGKEASEEDRENFFRRNKSLRNLKDLDYDERNKIIANMLPQFFPELFDESSDYVVRQATRIHAEEVEGAAEETSNDDTMEQGP